MGNKIPENLSGPLFPDGFEGNDEPLDQGTSRPRTDDEKQLFRAFGVREPKPKSVEWFIEQFRAEGAILARMLEPMDNFAGIKKDLIGIGMVVEKISRTTDEGNVEFVVAWPRRES